MPIVLYGLAMEHFTAWWELELHAHLTQGVAARGGAYALLNFKYK
jgi:hypothetical protein